MYIKRLTISTPTGKVIRDIPFKNGLNLIIDNTPLDNLTSTGNNVGKTTVLKLIDFCLGANPNIIYTDAESKKGVYDLVKDFLVDEKVEITLLLTDDIEKSGARELKIKRNFLARKNAVREINNEPVPDKDFVDELERNIFPNKTSEKPTFRQVIAHNIRYRDESINNTLFYLDRFTKDIEYETLYLYMLGCSFEEGAKKQLLIEKINQEATFKSRLEKNQSKTTYELSLLLVDDEIAVLNRRKDSFNLNENLEEDLSELNNVKYNINKTSLAIGRLKIRKNLIEESINELENNSSSMDLQQIKQLYEEATSVDISQIHKTFEDLVEYHNKMIIEKVKFISQELPDIDNKIKDLQDQLGGFIENEKRLSAKIAKGDSFEELGKVISSLNEQYRLKGEYESIISQLDEIDNNIDTLGKEIEIIDEYLFSADFESILREQVIKFNKYFSTISQELYGEKYALTYDKKTNKKGQQFYKFSAFNTNMSQGKKQGEILCFDLGYLLFADDENIPNLKFLLNDRKELMSDNQLISVAKFVKDKNIQLIVSILKDKLPLGALEKAHVAVELSQDEKLFKIENNND